MPLLFLVSFIWAFSFGLTKGQLAGVDSAFISAARLGLALLVFLPFLRWRGIGVRTGLALAGIGAVQFGVMYLALNESYRYLHAYEVVLLTITTPIMVTVLADALERKFRLHALLAALLAVAGAAFIALKSTGPALTLSGVLLVQLSNAAFAIGQVLYRQIRRQQPGLRDSAVFGLLYVGAFAVALVALLLRLDGLTITLNSRQILTLLYLGVLASGICFFLWNVGATRVTAGTLAVMNNVKVPLGVACSLLFFGERADLPRLLVGGALMGAGVWLAGKDRSTAGSENDRPTGTLGGAI